MMLTGLVFQRLFPFGDGKRWPITDRGYTYIVWPFLQDVVISDASITENLDKEISKLQ